MRWSRCSSRMAVAIFWSLPHFTVVSDAALPDATPPPAAHSAIVTAASRLPEHIRKAVMSGVGFSMEGEGRLKLAPGKGEHDELLSIGQRKVWMENFNNARDSGMSVPEAQKVALRGAADGKIYIDPKARDDEFEVPAGISYTDRSKAETVTCMSCHHTMVGRPNVLAHYKGDWHAFNSQRRNGDLAPISEVGFLQRVQSTSDELAEVARNAAMQREEGGDGSEAIHGHHRVHPGHGKATVGGDMLTRRASPKGGGSVPGGDAPLTAREERKRMRAAKRKMVIPCEMMPVDPLPDFAVRVAGTTCPFDGAESRSVEENVEHMSLRHGFRLPTTSPVVPGAGPGVSDVEGLVSYLVRKVYVGHACVSCGDTFHSVKGVQDHMGEKGHCRLPRDEQVAREELLPFLPKTELGNMSAERRGDLDVGGGAFLSGEDLAGRVSNIGLSSEEGGGAACGSRAEAFVRARALRGESDSHPSPVEGMQQPQSGGYDYGGGGPVGYADVSSKIRSRLCKAMRKREGAGHRLSEDKREARKEKAEALEKTVKQHRAKNFARAGWREQEFARRIMARSEGIDEDSLIPTGKALAPGMQIIGGSSASTALCVTRAEPGTVATYQQSNKASKMKTVGDTKNYYTRKSMLGKTNWGVLNSGHRP